MTTKKKILLAGETWISSATHIKGFDQFYTTTSHSGAEPFIAALHAAGFDVDHLPGHDCAARFPDSAEALDAYDAVILSDIGANTLLLPPAVWLDGRPVTNRLKLLRDWTAQGHGLMMVGGYLTFQGIDGKARWHRTAVEEALPVTCLPYDDRLEIPEGFHAEILKADHPLLRGMPADWPLLLGANEVTCRDRADCEVLVRLPKAEGGHPLLVTGHWGRGRTVAWMSDIGPHWVPNEFVQWPGYATLWGNIMGWLTQQG
ncbi:MAG: glutamine amidotransferase [Gluconacetobacter sp.]|uniref:Cytoplasmic protein n=1 Tax=Gluconacetobacter dulcium TaxID=2729096 RepID=A0A7W4JW90_9PROT|nr:glutamine amidotransferase [Gluconacetobacter dulcium]MBB2195898.1 cytoplasmic protein [Gluconacetobacter dulcium]